MQNPYTFEFDCQKCKQPVKFSTQLLDESHPIVGCEECRRKYNLEDETLKRQLKQFEGLCRQIRNSREILGNASVGVDVGDKQIKIPYKLLLTRLTSHLDLMIGGEPLTVTLRVEPLDEQGNKPTVIKKERPKV